jgi:hypothetical protein
LARLADEVAIDGAQDCTGSLQAPLLRLSQTSVIRLKPSRLFRVERVGAVVHLRAPGQVLEIPDPMGQALEQLLQCRSLTLGALQGLDEEQRLALCQRLVAANVLEIV